MPIKNLKGQGRQISPVRTIKATPTQIAAVKEVLDRHTKGLTILYESTWVGCAYQGGVSTAALARYYAGDKNMCKEQAHVRGLYRWHNVKLRDKFNAPEQPVELGFDGMDDLNTFLAAKPADQDKYLKEHGII